MLIGRGTYEVAKQMPDEEGTYEGGAQFVLTHDPPDKPDPNVTFLTCDIAEAVATALRAAGGKIVLLPEVNDTWVFRSPPRGSR